MKRRRRERPRRRYERDVRTPEALAAIRKLKSEFEVLRGRRIWIEMREREVHPRKRCGGTRLTSGAMRRDHPGCCASCLRPKAPRTTCVELVPDRSREARLKEHFSILRADGSMNFGGLGRCGVSTELGGGWSVAEALKKARKWLRENPDGR